LDKYDEYETRSEPNVIILDEFVKPKFLGQHQRYKCIVFKNQIVFLRTNRRWFFGKKFQVSDKELQKMSPLSIKKLSLGSYMLQIKNISSIIVRESIPFVLVLDPKEAANFNLTGAEDDIVNEVPLVLRRDKANGFDIVERQWKITFDSPKAVTSFITPYDPRLKLPEKLLEKIK
jgi:hypothetical protein